MSALPPKADMAQHRCDVRFVPKADIAAVYSITSSAVESSVGGTVSPSILAVWMLMMPSMSVGGQKTTSASC